MAEYIEREQAVTVFKTFYGKSLRVMLDALAEEHAADVRPVVRARWKYIEYYPEGHDYKCQHCRFKNAEPTNYCPSCGAVMMGVDE